MVVIELAAEDEEKQEVEDEKRNEEQEEEGRSGDGTTSRTTDSSVAEVVGSDKRGEKEKLDAKITAEIEASTDLSSKPGKSSSTADLTSARAGKEPESDLHEEYI
jgi:hypothetical protein